MLPSGEICPVGNSIELMREREGGGPCKHGGRVGIHRDFEFPFIHGMSRDGVLEHRYPWRLWVRGGAIAADVRMGMEMLPMTPWWSRKVKGMFCVFPIWCVMCLGSERMR